MYFTKSVRASFPSGFPILVSINASYLAIIQCSQLAREVVARVHVAMFLCVGVVGENDSPRTGSITGTPENLGQARTGSGSIDSRR